VVQGLKLKEHVLGMNARLEDSRGAALGSDLPREPAIESFGPGLMSETQTAVHRLGWIAAALLCTVYVAYLFSLTSFPFQDYPNHLARGAVMADLLFENGARFGHSYSLALSPIPYVLHDLLLAGCIELCGIKAGGALFATLVFMSLPLALLFYLHVTQLAPRAKLFVFLVSLYLSADGFFVMAFMGFRLALAEIIVCLALAEMLRKRWSRGLFGVYVMVLILGYLTHLAAPVFFAVALGTSSLLRVGFGATTVRRELYLLIPVGALLGLHFGVLASPHTQTNPPEYEYSWGTLHQKLQRLLFEFERFGARPALAMMIMLAACLLWPVRKALHMGAFTKLTVFEPLAIAGVFLAFYWILPREYADSSYVDVRALSITALMLLLACLNLPDASTSGRTFDTLPVLALAGLLAIGNLAYLVRHVGRDDALLTRYREVATWIPRGATVLPIYTRQREGVISPFMHAGSLLVVDRGAVIPYLFSSDRGDAMKYFRYVKRPYMPDEGWYKDQLLWDKGVEQTYEVGGRPYTWRFIYSKTDKEWQMLDLSYVDWNRVACDYDFLMVTMPVEMSMVHVPTRRVRANDAAALLAVDKVACQPDQIVKRRVHLPSEH
jgi:hypothetical protein